MAGDEFEAENMHDGAPIVHRDKRVSRGMTGMFFGSGGLMMAAAVLVGIMNRTSTKPLPDSMLPAMIGSMLLFGVAMWIGGIMFGVLRTLVTKKAVHIKYGLWGPTIPLEAIESARVKEYDWKEFGGWGMKIGKGGARAYVPGTGPVMEIVYRDGDKSRRVVVGPENAAATVQAINEARGHVRIADDVATEASTEREAALAEAEEAAEEESERAKLAR